MKRMVSDLETGPGTACTLVGAVTALTFWVRYQDISLGMRRGPTVKRRVLRLWESQYNHDRWVEFGYVKTNVERETMIMAIK